MASKELRSQIKQMEKGETDFGISSSLKTLNKKFLGNEIVAELDFFSVPVKLNINGQQDYKTFFGGLIHLFLIIGCCMLTLYVIYPNGIQFNSQITQTKLVKDYGDTGQTLFDHVDIPISFRGLLNNGSTFIETSISDFASIYAYQTYNDGSYYQLEVSSLCQNGADFCLKKTNQNRNAKIYGRPANEGEDYAFVQFEVIWCDMTDFSCPDPTPYGIQLQLSNFYKEKGGTVSQFKISSNMKITNWKYNVNVTRQIYSSNTKFFGHMSNVFSFEIQSYKFDSSPQITFDDSDMKTEVNYSNHNFLKIKHLPYGDTLLITQDFDDFGSTILFFLSVKQTFYFLIFVIFIKQYNKNSGYLQIGSGLYYINDPKTKKKYNFKKGYEVFIACWLHNHPIGKISDFILSKFGRTMKNYLPNKSIYAISLINKAEELLHENKFYGNLNDLVIMESQAPKKVQLYFNEKSDIEEKQMQYFPFQIQDNEQTKKEKEAKRQAFNQFCQVNQYVSAKRKNDIYNVLINNKLRCILTHQMQSQFKSFIKSVKMQFNQRQEQYPSQNDEIRVSINDAYHEMTAGSLTKGIHNY